MTKKPSHKNFGWEPIRDTNDAEKTLAFGSNPLKTHRIYGSSPEDLQAQIEAFEERLKAANGEDDG